jgi:DNA-binding transcriptional LysR family regulator
MTAAAQELHLTQSGISQSIRALEDLLGVPLFDRIKRRLIPTRMAQLLFEKSTESLYGIEQVLTLIKRGEPELSGTLTLGMPTEFGNNIILPLLSRFCQKHPRIRFSIRYGLGTQMNMDLLEGRLDFAFLDGFSADKRITLDVVYHELLLLCGTEEMLNRIGEIEESRRYFESLEYVDYQIGEPVLRLWFGHHLGYKNLNLNIRATGMNAQGIARMILNGFAVGVLPGHLVSKLRAEGHSLYSFQGCGNPLKNQISIAHLKERTQTSMGQYVMQWLLHEMRGAETSSNIEMSIPLEKYDSRIPLEL